MKTEKFNPQTQPTENPWGTSDLNIDVDKILAKENDDSALRESELLRLAVEMRAIADGKIPQNNEQSGFELAMREADEIIEKSRQRDIKNKENREFIADDIIKSINKERFMDNIEKIYFEVKYANIMNQEGDDQEQLTTLLNRFESDPKMPKEDLLKGISGISNETIAKLEPRLGVSEEEFMKFSNANQEYVIFRNVWETTREKDDDLILIEPLEIAHKMEQYEHIWRLIGEYNFCFIFQNYYKQFSSRDAFRRLKGLEEDLQTPIFDKQDFLGRIVDFNGNIRYYRNYRKILLRNGTKILQRSPEVFYTLEEEIYTDDTMPEARLLYNEDIDWEADQWKNIIERTNGDLICLPRGIHYPSKWLEGEGEGEFSLRNLWPFRKRD